MMVRSKEMVFTGGRRLRVDPSSGLTDPFNYEPKEGHPLPKHLVPADGQAHVVKAATLPGQAHAPAKTGQPTKKELMAQLAAAGVKFKATLGNVELQALLDAAKKEAAPAASVAPSKEPAGTGDQDVI